MVECELKEGREGREKTGKDGGERERERQRERVEREGGGEQDKIESDRTKGKFFRER